MARSHLTLAALAVGILPHLEVDTAVSLSRADGDFDTALLTDSQGKHYIVRVPRNPRAESRLGKEQGALTLLGRGARDRLPFEVPVILGSTAFEGTKAYLYEYVYGRSFTFPQLASDPELAQSVGSAIAAMHSLPRSIAGAGSLTQRTPADTRRQVLELLDRAIATRKVPVALADRWERISADNSIWQYQPTISHGNLSLDTLLSIGSDVTGVLDWHELKIDDPAKDLAWVFAHGSDAINGLVLESYQNLRQNMADDQALVSRAKLHSEMEVAQWLVFGHNSRQDAIVADAVGMMNEILARSADEVADPATRRSAASLLEETQALPNLDFEDPDSGSAGWTEMDDDTATQTISVVDEDLPREEKRWSLLGDDAEPGFSTDPQDRFDSGEYRD